MLSFPFANPPPGQFYSGLAIGLTIAVVSLWAFFGRKPSSGWRRLAGLCILTVALGPLAGAGVAGLTVALGDVHPLDRWWLVSSFIVVGTVASLITAVLVGIAGTLRMMGRGHSAGGPLDDELLQAYCWKEGGRAIMVIRLMPEIETALVKEAQRQGTTPEKLANDSLGGWLLSSKAAGGEAQDGSLFEFLSGYVGTVSGATEAWSEDCGRHFVEGLVEKQETGRL